MLVAGWLIVSGLGSITMMCCQVSKFLARFLLLTQLIFAILALIWLVKACIARFSHTGKVCSGDYYKVDKMWGYPGPYLYDEGEF